MFRRARHDTSDAPVLGPVVETANGNVRGYVAAGIHTFRGLRYGAPTGGINRFKPPVTPARWNGVAQTFIAAGGFTAPQLLSPPIPPLSPAFKSDAPISEDCLFLNLFSPGIADGKRPVMVWIHGGGYSIESGTAPIYDGTNLARLGDVVVVTVNHRLNVFGHLYLADLLGADYADSGNVGLLDIVAALRWVRDNVAAFGGDPTSVTLFGQSGGGAKICALLAMPSARGLFHKAIIQSGSALRMGTLDRASMNTERVLTYLGLTRDRADDLRNLPMERFLPMGGIGGAAPAAGGPIVDGRSLPRHPFDPDAPAISADVPVLVGSNETEMTTIASDETLFALDSAGLRERLARQLGDRTAQVIDAFRAGRASATASDLYFLIASFLRTTKDTLELAERRAALDAAATYVYQFIWKTPVEGGKYRSPHYLDLPFVHNNLRGAETLIGDGPELQPMADRFGKLWTSFARTGAPSAARSPTWEPFTLATRATLLIDTRARLVHDPLKAERLALLDVAATGPGR